MTHLPTSAASPATRPLSEGADLRNVVVGIAADVLDMSPGDVGETSTLLEVGGEALMFVEIVLKLETAYGVHVDRSYALPIRHTVGDSLAVVRAGLAHKSAPSAAEGGTR